MRFYERLMIEKESQKKAEMTKEEQQNSNIITAITLFLHNNDIKYAYKMIKNVLDNTINGDIGLTLACSDDVTDLCEFVDNYFGEW